MLATSSCVRDAGSVDAGGVKAMLVLVARFYNQHTTAGSIVASNYYLLVVCVRVRVCVSLSHTTSLHTHAPPSLCNLYVQQLPTDSSTCYYLLTDLLNSLATCDSPDLSFFAPPIFAPFFFKVAVSDSCYIYLYIYLYAYTHIHIYILIICVHKCV